MTLHSPKILWPVRVVVALILLQTLFFKFTGAEESVYIFKTVSEWLTGSDSLEASMRLGSGATELLAAALLLIPKPRAAAAGAAVALGTISGAIFFHLTALGVIVQDDGGVLFALAVVVFVGSAWVLSGTWRDALLPAKNS